MKIGNPLDKPGLAPVTGQRNQPAAASGTKVDAGVNSTDSSTVALSSAATSLLAGAQAASAEFDTAKVERISNAISQGQFTINPEAIADKLIANAQELLNRPH